MIVRVQLFARLKELAGTGLLDLELPEGASVGQLRAALVDRLPDAAPLAGHLMFAVNRAYVSDATAIPPQAEIACIPPVSGG